MDDLPVTVRLHAPLDREVAAWVERDLGWQIVEPGSALPAALCLSDRPISATPWIAVLASVADEVEAVRLLTEGAEDVVNWPDERERIPLIAARVHAQRQAAPRRRQLDVRGATGGAGTSTIALALGGLLAWRGASVLVVGSIDLLVLAGVDGPGITAGAHVAVPSVANLSVACRRADRGVAPSGDRGVPWSGDVVIVDGGAPIEPETDVIVTRPDLGVRRAADADAPVVVNGSGPLSDAEVRRVLGDRVAVQLPWSARVARAGVRGCVPTGLPGRWYRDLSDSLSHLVRGEAR